MLASGAFKNDVLAVSGEEGCALGKKLADLNVVDAADVKAADGVSKTVDINGDKATLTLVKA